MTDHNLAATYCDRLNISYDRRNNFRRDLLLQFQNEHGPELDIDHHRIGSTIKELFATGFLTKYQSTVEESFGKHNALSDQETRQCLQLLFDLYFEERLRLQSQEDPSYSASSKFAASPRPKATPKKRKQPPGLPVVSNANIARPSKKPQQDASTPKSLKWSAVNNPQTPKPIEKECRNDTLVKSAPINVSSRSGRNSSFETLNDFNSDDQMENEFNLDRIINSAAKKGKVDADTKGSSQCRSTGDDVVLIDVDSDHSTSASSQSVRDGSRRRRDVMTDVSDEAQTPTRQRKGKAIVRDPPDQSQSGLCLLSTATKKRTESDILASPSKKARTTSVGNKISREAEPKSITSMGPLEQATTNQTFRQNMTNIEKSKSNAGSVSHQDSPILSSFYDPEGAVEQNSPSTPDRSHTLGRSLPTRTCITMDLPTPPLTVGRPQINESLGRFTIRSHRKAKIAAGAGLLSPTSSFGPPDFVLARAHGLHDEIRDYLARCEEHNNKVARDGESSERERTRHGIMAAAFAHLKMDIGSRIDRWEKQEEKIARLADTEKEDAVRENGIETGSNIDARMTEGDAGGERENEDGEVVVTNYCLLYP